MCKKAIVRVCISKQICVCAWERVTVINEANISKEPSYASVKTRSLKRERVLAIVPIRFCSSAEGRAEGG